MNTAIQQYSDIITLSILMYTDVYRILLVNTSPVYSAGNGGCSSDIGHARCATIRGQKRASWFLSVTAKHVCKHLLIWGDIIHVGLTCNSVVKLHIPRLLHEHLSVSWYLHICIYVGYTYD